MIVRVDGVTFFVASRRLGLLLGSHLLWLGYVALVTEVARLSELLIVVVVDLGADYGQLSLVLRLINTRLRINTRERYVFALGIEREQRNSPVASFVVPLRSLVQFIQFILRQQNTHDLVAEFDSLLLATNNIEQLAFLLLMFLSEVLDLCLGRLVLGPQLLHDFTHRLNFLLQ